jgi:hypothetical protein
LAAGAAILAAVLALGGTWWNSLVAAKSAAETVTKQVSGETEKSRAEFLRGQRLVLYSKILTDEQRLMDAENAVDSWQPIDGPKNFDERLKTVGLRRRALQADMSSAQILASKEFIHDLDALYRSHQNIQARSVIEHLRSGDANETVSGIPPYGVLRDQRKDGLDGIISLRS